MRRDGPIQRSDGQVLSGGESLGSLGTLLIDVGNDIRAARLSPKRLGQAPLKDLGVARRRTAALDRVGDIF